MFEQTADAFQHKNHVIAWLLVGLTILVNTVFDSILAYFAGAWHPIPDPVQILRNTLFGCGSYRKVPPLEAAHQQFR